MKKIITKGIYGGFNADTFFYLKKRKETEKSIIFEFGSFSVGSINTFSSDNFGEDDIYAGFQSIYGWTEKEVRDRLLEEVL